MRLKVEEKQKKTEERPMITSILASDGHEKFMVCNESILVLVLIEEDLVNDLDKLLVTHTLRNRWRGRLVVWVVGMLLGVSML